MIMIQFRGMVATWNSEQNNWDAADDIFEKELNRTLPEELNDVQSAFREGGPEGMALAELQRVFGSELEVVKQTPYTPPEEEEGVVF